MAQQKIEIQKEVYNKGLLDQTINTQFTQLTRNINREAELRASIETVDEFFRLYDLLFFDIPKEGAVNSHQYIIQESTDYVGAQEDNAAIQALLDEIADLRQQLLNANQTLADQGLTPQQTQEQAQYSDANSLIKGTPLTQQTFTNKNVSSNPGSSTIGKPGVPLSRQSPSTINVTPVFTGAKPPPNTINNQDGGDEEAENYGSL